MNCSVKVQRMQCLSLQFIGLVPLQTAASVRNVYARRNRSYESILYACTGKDCVPACVCPYGHVLYGNKIKYAVRCSFRGLDRFLYVNK